MAMQKLKKQFEKRRAQHSIIEVAVKDALHGVVQYDCIQLLA